MSHGEELIEKILRKAKISFEKEKTFTDLRNGKYRYDFYIPNLNGKPTIIEYNGAQHYEFIKTFYQSPRFWLAALERDRRKISYALANNMDLFIIPYWDYPLLKTKEDLFKPEYKAADRWHNDNVRQKMKKK